MRRIQITALLLAAVLVSGACAGDAPETLIGVRGVSLSLAFTDEKLAEPVPTREIVTIIPAAPELLEQVVPDYDPPPLASPALPAPPPIPFPEPCPKAPEGAAPAEVATVAITRPPTEGVYLKQNTGSIKVEGGVIPLTLPYPPFSKLTISEVKTSERSDVYRGTVRTTTFVAEEQISSALIVRSYFSYDHAQLNLVKEEVINQGEVTTFQPTPALQVLAFTGPGNTWNAAAIDTTSSEAATVRGAIAPQRELIDVCGKVVDTLKVSTDEQRLSLTDASVNGSDNGQPIVQNYALQLGGLVLRREEHSTRVMNVQGARVVVSIDVVSRLMSTTPMEGLLF